MHFALSAKLRISKATDSMAPWVTASVGLLATGSVGPWATGRWDPGLR